MRKAYQVRISHAFSRAFGSKMMSVGVRSCYHKEHVRFLILYGHARYMVGRLSPYCN